VISFSGWSESKYHHHNHATRTTSDDVIADAVRSTPANAAMIAMIRQMNRQQIMPDEHQPRPLRRTRLWKTTLPPASWDTATTTPTI